MGKTIKKNQTAKRNARGVSAGTYVVRGRAYSVAYANADSIAEDMVANGYRTGSQARWNGGAYVLERDVYGDHSLTRVA